AGHLEYSATNIVPDHSDEAKILNTPVTELIESLPNPESEEAMTNLYKNGITISHWFSSHRDITVVTPALLWLGVFLTVFLAYFGYAEAHGDHGFSWWEIFSIWTFIVAIMLDYVWNAYYWSPSNRISTLNEKLSTADHPVYQMRLLVNTFVYNMISHLIWTVAECLIAFLILGGGWNMPAPTTFFA
ncbi:MAG: hypothetical protein KGJ07_09950, partial [Patescibacteria group bacterium]|nr:hypothetical protein [Patescibacteria group bacterium]